MKETKDNIQKIATIAFSVVYVLFSMTRIEKVEP